MKCPHCLIAFHDKWFQKSISDAYIENQPVVWYLDYTSCPTCGQIIIKLLCFKVEVIKDSVKVETKNPIKEFLVYPKTINRNPCPKEVPEKYANDYFEACLVLSDSPKASAALSRRCLQNILREVAKVKKGDLSNEIQEVIDNKSLLSYLSESIDAIRNIGNFAAHPMKSKSTGEIADVEPGEAEWTLTVLESLFDFYFVQPEIIKNKRSKLNIKLKDLGKPDMK